MVAVIESGFHTEMYLAYSSSLARLGPFQNWPSSRVSGWQSGPSLMPGRGTGKGALVHLLARHSWYAVPLAPFPPVMGPFQFIKGLLGC